VHLIYLDDSRDEGLCVFSALAVPADQWRAAFQQLRDYRRQLRRTYGIFVYKELHAWKFVSGRGRPSDRTVTKSQRCGIFRQVLDLTADLQGARLFNACFPPKDDVRAFEWLVNRINRTLQTWGSHGLLISDEGNELVYTRLVRRMRVYNPIPSQFGAWSETGAASRNIPIERIVEDPVFKRSEQSYFIQAVDFCAYALLRRERPTEYARRYGVATAFDALSPILVREARPRDADGIIRP
jgi:hypothetical protein